MADPRRNSKPRWESTPVDEGGGLGLTREQRKGRCRECGEKVSGRRRSWCSDECVDSYLVRSDANHARRKLLERDRGVCALCGLDTLALQARVREVILETTRVWREQKISEAPHAVDQYRYVRFRRTGWNPLDLEEWIKKAVREALLPHGMARLWRRKTLWDADHVKAVADGGNELGLENLRTLCVSCHQERSRLQAKRRARRRRGLGPRRIR